MGTTINPTTCANERAAYICEIGNQIKAAYQKAVETGTVFEFKCPKDYPEAQPLIDMLKARQNEAEALKIALQNQRKAMMENIEQQLSRQSEELNKIVTMYTGNDEVANMLNNVRKSCNTMVKKIPNIFRVMGNLAKFVRI